MDVVLRAFVSWEANSAAVAFRKKEVRTKKAMRRGIDFATNIWALEIHLQGL